jgi:hypothetical protein
MERLALCSKVLYDHDILQKQKEIIELKKNLKLLENPKIVCNNWNEWTKKEEFFVNLVEERTRKIIYLHLLRVYTENDPLNRFVSDPFAPCPAETGIVYVFYRYLLEELTIFTNNEVWSEKIADNITISLSSFFKSFDVIKGFLYSNLSDEEIVSVIAKNVSNQLHSYFENCDIVKSLN